MRQYLAFALVWTPLVCAVVVFAMSGADGLFGTELLLSLAIAEVTTFCCVWGTVALVRTERRLLGRGGGYREPGVLARAMRSTLFMFPGMTLGFAAAGALSRALGTPWEPPRLGDYRAGLIFGVVSVTLFCLVDMRREAAAARAEAEARARELETLGMRAKIAALTAQLNPHLLFNALNSIASMIPAEPEAAETMTLALARVYRRVLGAADKDLHPLADELELVSAFLEVERGRFADRLRFCVEVDPELSPDRVPVPVLCLQPFVENAVKHGLSSLSGGGTVWVRASRRLNAWELSVEDDGVGLGKARPSTGSGTAIANFRARLLLLYQGKAAFEVAAREPTGTRVTVRIPA